MKQHEMTVHVRKLNCRNVCKDYRDAVFGNVTLVVGCKTHQTIHVEYIKLLFQFGTHDEPEEHEELL